MNIHLLAGSPPCKAPAMAAPAAAALSASSTAIAIRRAACRAGLATALAALLSVTMSLPVRADEGHDHDAPSSTASALPLPRFVAASERFELVGVLNGPELTVYLDRFADNAPVTGATVTLNIGGAPVTLHEHDGGEFEGTLPEALMHDLAHGAAAVTATITAGAETDSLATHLVLHLADHAHETPSNHWRTWGAWVGGGLLLLLLLLVPVGVRLRRAVIARGRIGGAA